MTDTSSTPTPLSPATATAAANATVAASSGVAPNQVGDQEWGIVQSIDPTSPPTLTVKIGSNPTPTPNIPYVASYVPTVMDNVIVEWVGISTSDPVVTGVLATTALPSGAAVLQTLLPVGATWISGLASNPSTYLGFGTWVATATGQFLVGAGTSDRTFVGGTAGGSSTITSQNLPALPPWTLSLGLHGHDSSPSGNFFVGTGGTGATVSAGSGNQALTIAASATNDALNNNAGGGQQYVPPFFVLYVWVRTA